MNSDYKKVLQEEREKLNRLVDEALENGTPLSKSSAIMQQCKKLDDLISEREDQ